MPLAGDQSKTFASFDRITKSGGTTKDWNHLILFLSGFHAWLQRSSDGTWLACARLDEGGPKSGRSDASRRIVARLRLRERSTSGALRCSS